MKSKGEIKVKKPWEATGGIPTHMELLGPHNAI